MNASFLKSGLLWLVQVVIAFLFAVAAIGKLVSAPTWVSRFEAWGYPPKFYLVIGALEALGAIGLVIPRVAGYAASGLIVIMVGAAFTNISHHDGLEFIRPIVYLLVLAFIIYRRFPRSSAVHGTATILPNNPSAYPFGPAVKNSSFG